MLLHNKRVQFPQILVWTTNMAAVLLFGTPIWLL